MMALTYCEKFDDMYVLWTFNAERPSSAW